MLNLQNIGMGGGTLTVSRGGATKAVRIGLRYNGGWLSNNSCLSYNTPDWNDYIPILPALNLCKMMRVPEIGGGDVANWDDIKAAGVDAQGYPNNWQPAWDGYEINYYFAWADVSSEYIRQYRLTWDGDDVVTMWNCTVHSQQPNEIVFTPAQANWAINESKWTTQHPHNFECVAVGSNETLYAQGEIFDPLFLHMFRSPNIPSSLRHMDWMHTNFPVLTSWADRTPVDYMTYSIDTGVPFEIQVALSHKLGCDLWTNIPHTCVPYTDTTSFATELAQFMKANLDPDLKLHLEVSNEVWNGAFPVHNWVRDQALLAGWSDTENIRPNYMAKLNCDVFRAVKAVYGNEASDRLVCVAGTSTIQTYWTTHLINPTDWAAAEPGNYVDPMTVYNNVSVAAYVGGELLSDETERNALLAEIDTGATDAQVNAYIRSRSLAGDWLGTTMTGVISNVAIVAPLPLTAYEGGLHFSHSFAVEGIDPEDLDKLTDAANTYSYSTEGAQEMADLWAAWRDNGGMGPFMQFTASGTAGKFGAWGSIRNYSDEGNPRHQQLITDNQSQDRWWEDNRVLTP